MLRHGCRILSARRGLRQLAVQGYWSVRPKSKSIHTCSGMLAGSSWQTMARIRVPSRHTMTPIIATRHPLAHPGFPDAAYSNGGRDHQQILCAPESAREFLQAELRKMRIESMSRESGLAACADAKNDAHSLCTVSTDDQSVDAQVKELGVQTLPGPATAILACAETFTPPASAAIDKALLQFCSFIVCDGNAR